VTLLGLPGRGAGRKRCRRRNRESRLACGSKASCRPSIAPGRRSGARASRGPAASKSRLSKQQSDLEPRQGNTSGAGLPARQHLFSHFRATGPICGGSRPDQQIARQYDRATLAEPATHPPRRRGRTCSPPRRVIQLRSPRTVRPAIRASPAAQQTSSSGGFFENPVRRPHNQHVPARTGRLSQVRRGRINRTPGCAHLRTVLFPISNSNLVDPVRGEGTSRPAKRLCPAARRCGIPTAIPARDVAQGGRKHGRVLPGHAHAFPLPGANSRRCKAAACPARGWGRTPRADQGFHRWTGRRYAS